MKNEQNIQKSINIYNAVFRKAFACDHQKASFAAATAL